MNAKRAQSIKEVIPAFIAPMLATLTNKQFDSKDWLFEVKYDGYRTIARVEGNQVDLLSRNNLSFNDLFSPIRKELTFLGFNCILDGEVVVLNKDGLPDFNLLQNYGKTRKGFLVFFIFDVLFYQNTNLCALPLINRKKILEALPIPYGEKLQLCKHIHTDGIDLFEAAKRMGMEGIIAKKASSLYISGRSKDWLKIKNYSSCEAIILGYMKSDKRKYFASLLLGYYNGSELQYIGNTGSGFTSDTEKLLYDKFTQLHDSGTESFVPPRYRKNVVFLKPLLVCRIQYQEITSAGMLRQCIYKGLIEKNALEITAIC